MNNNLDSISIENIDIDYEFITIFKDELNIKTLKELLIVNDYNIYIAFKKIYNHNCESKIKELKNQIHILGYLFDEERKIFEKEKINELIAFIKIEDLGFKNSIKKLLRWKNIIILGELLLIDYNVILEKFRFNEEELINLRQVVHEVGGFFINESPTLKEILYLKRKKDISLIGDVWNLDIKLSSILYRNDIFTIEDLLNYGPKVFSLVGIGPYRKKQLEVLMLNNGLEFINKEKDDMELLVDELQGDNLIIKEKLKKKEQLINYYDKLVKENQKLLERNDELDAKLKKVLEEAQTLLGGNTYGKK